MELFEFCPVLVRTSQVPWGHSDQDTVSPFQQFIFNVFKLLRKFSFAEFLVGGPVMLTLIIVFQNCSQGFEAGSSNVTTNPSENSSTNLEGLSKDANIFVGGETADLKSKRFSFDRAAITVDEAQLKLNVVVPEDRNIKIPEIYTDARVDYILFDPEDKNGSKPFLSGTLILVANAQARATVTIDLTGFTQSRILVLQFVGSTPPYPSLQKSIPLIIYRTRAKASHLDYKQIAMGTSHSCAVLFTDEVACWGQNQAGQLGLGVGATFFSETPVIVAGLSQIKLVRVGEFHSCALHINGSVSCWGNNTYGQTGSGSLVSASNIQPATVSTPQQVPGLNGGIDLSIGNNHTCVLLSDRSVKCWGRNNQGQLGIGSTSFGNPAPVLVSTGGDVSELALGASHSCAQLQNGTVACWGGNSFGQCGNNSGALTLTPTAVSGLTMNSKSIRSGLNHSCAVLQNGEVACWGINNAGELGRDLPAISFSAVIVAGINNVESLGLGDTYSCALSKSKNVFCWGTNKNGILGNQVTQKSYTPVRIQPLTQISKLESGPTNVCAVHDGEDIFCWGATYFGQVIIGSATFPNKPAVVPGLSGVSSISSGLGHTCALAAGGTVKCFGRNISGELGTGSLIDSYVPLAVENLKDILSMKVGFTHSCAIKSDRSVICWGQNNAGQLGSGSITVQTTTPVPVNGLLGAQELAVGGDHTCALLIDKTVKCWGGNNFGQLGNGSTTNSLIPVLVNGLSDVKAIASDWGHTCALLMSGAVTCWGHNLYGQLGNNSMAHSSLPVTVIGISSAKTISVSGVHSCVSLTNGDGYCWGYNYSGMLGNGSTTNSSVPVKVQNLTNIQAIYLGGTAYRSCAVLMDQTAWCWGFSNSSAEIGSISGASSLVPQQVEGLPPVVSLSMGQYFTCALGTDQAVRCFGGSDYGQTGRWKMNPVFSPVPILPPYE